MKNEDEIKQEKYCNDNRQTEIQKGWMFLNNVKNVHSSYSTSLITDLWKPFAQHSKFPCVLIHKFCDLHGLKVFVEFR